MRILLCTIIAFFSLEAYGQKMLWSTPQKITNRNYYTQILGQNSSGIFYYQTSKTNQNSNIQVVALEHNMKSKARQELLTSSKEYLHQAVLMKKHLILFYSVHDRKDGIIFLYAKKLDGDLNTIGQDQQISSIGTNTFRPNYFRIIPSRYQDEVLVATAQNPDSIMGPMSIKVLNNQLDVIHKSTLEANLRGASLSNSVFINGVWMMMATKTAKDGLFSRVRQKTLVRHDCATSTTQIHDLFTNDWNTLHGEFSFSPQDSIYMFSSYYFREDSLKPEGFVQYAFSVKKDSVGQTKHAFPVQMLEDLFGKGSRRPSTNQLVLKKALKRSDGGTIFISEKREVDEQVIQDVSLYGIPQNYTRYYYYFYDISILSLNKDGSVDWHQTVKKEQISLNDDGYYSSFGCEISNDRLYFVFNDLTRKSGNVMIYGIKPNGTSRGEILINGRQFDGYAIPKESIQLSSSTLLIPMIKPREGFTLLKLEF